MNKYHACTEETIKRQLEWLHPGGAPFEIRTLEPQEPTLGWAKINSGYFTDAAVATTAIIDNYEKYRPAKTWVTLNPTIAAVIGRANNRIKVRAVSVTADTDIAAVRNILIDCDPARPKGVPATTDERLLAGKRAKAIREFLGDKGYGEPLVGMSGNGWHLIYAVEFADTTTPADASQEVKRLLKILQFQFGDDDIAIDTSVSSPGQCTKIFGIMHYSGDDFEDRINVQSDIKEYPKRIPITSLKELNDSIGGEYDAAKAKPKPVTPQKSKKPYKANEDVGRLNVAKYLDRIGKKYKTEDGKKFILDCCVFNPDHCNGEVAIFENDNGSTGYNCFHNSCGDGKWSDVRNILGDMKHSDFYAEEVKKQAVEVEEVFNIVCMDTVIEKRIEWLWDLRFPQGMLSVLAGDGGEGKSFLTLEIAARISTGTPFIDTPNEPNPAGDVLILSGEDLRAEILRPRLRKQKADASRIYHIESMKDEDGRGVDIKRDVRALKRKLREANRNYRLLVIDPVNAYVGEINANSDPAIRGVLKHLQLLAADCNICIIGIMHFSKDKSQKAVSRVLGSVGYVNAARMVWNVVPDKDDPDKKLFLQSKTNIGAPQEGLAFRIVVDEEEQKKPKKYQIATLEWENGAVTITADEAVSGETSLGAAVEWIKAKLSDGVVSSVEIFKNREDAGISKSTLDRAKKQIGVKPYKMGSGWYWSLPTQTTCTDNGDSGCIEGE